MRDFFDVVAYWECRAFLLGGPRLSSQYRARFVSDLEVGLDGLDHWCRRRGKRERYEIACATLFAGKATSPCLHARVYLPKSAT